MINGNCNRKRRTLSHHAAFLDGSAVRISKYVIVASHVAAQVVLVRPAVVHAIPHGGHGALGDVTRTVLTGAAAAFGGIFVAAAKTAEIHLPFTTPLFAIGCGRRVGRLERVDKRSGF